jgi:7-keto-8-aminopelargonate synthetase-like enzyme
MLGDARIASAFADRMLADHSIHVVSFSFPVVPQGKVTAHRGGKAPLPPQARIRTQLTLAPPAPFPPEARIRTQLSAAHTEEQVDHAVAAFIDVGKQLGVIP